MEKREPLSTAGGNVHGFSCYGKQYGGCSNIKKNNYHQIKQSTYGYLFMYYVLTADNSSNPGRQTFLPEPRDTHGLGGPESRNIRQGFLIGLSLDPECMIQPSLPTAALKYLRYSGLCGLYLVLALGL